MPLNNVSPACGAAGGGTAGAGFCAASNGGNGPAAAGFGAACAAARFVIWNSVFDCAVVKATGGLAGGSGGSALGFAGKTLGERAHALIAISHPEDRERLEREWAGFFKRSPAE